MKSIVISSLLLFYFSNLYFLTHKQPSSHFFEGVIRYKVELIKKKDNYNYDTISMAIGKISDYFMKEGNFLVKDYDAISYETLYRVKENKIYTKKIWSDSVFYYDCGKPGLKILRFTITPHKERILGIDCSELKVFFKDKIITNYFNSDTLKIDPSWHEKYTFYNESFYSQKMKSLCLKFIIEKPNYSIAYTATSFTYKKLADDLFIIPRNKILVEED